MINQEWEATIGIRQSIESRCSSLPCPIDCSPSDGFLVEREDVASDSEDSYGWATATRLLFIASLFVFGQSAAALAVLHKARMLDCDLKPGNLM
jgi:phosphotransferase system  glucose/maltose/N-acetylglucosamine-specific IIC component